MRLVNAIDFFWLELILVLEASWSVLNPMEVEIGMYM